MPVSTLPFQAPSSSKSPHHHTGSEENDCISILDGARHALNAYLAQPSENNRRELLAKELVAASAAVALFARKDSGDPAVAVALDLIRGMSAAGVLVSLAPELARIQTPGRSQKFWPGLLARMLVQPPWQSPRAPSFSDVPDWLWEDYSAWIFTAPHSFQSETEADAFADFTAVRMAELAQWTGRNLGSPTVRGALQSYLTNFSFLPLTVSASSLKRHAELHRRLLTTGNRFDSSVTASTGVRQGRALRVAFVATHPSSIPEYSRQLDSERFEISLYVLEGAAEANGGDGNAASFAILSLLKSGNRTRQFQALASELADQLSELQTANLDVVIFTEELTASNGRLHQLAMHRLAPLHVCAGATISTGLPTMDLLVATAAEAVSEEMAEQFSERLAIRQGCHLTFNDLQVCDQMEGGARERLGLPADAFVVTTVARSIEITPTIKRAWAEVLSQVPHAFIVIQLLHSGALPAGAMESFATGWDDACTKVGIGSERVLILGGTIESLTQLQPLVKASDVFLDVGAFAEPDLLNVPLSLNVPIVAVSGATFRAQRGAGLLRSLGLEALIASDESHRARLVAELAQSSEQMTAFRTKLSHALATLPLCRDQLAIAESLSLLLEDAYDELHERGAAEFKKGTPLYVASRENTSVAELLRQAEDDFVSRDFVAVMGCAQRIFRAWPAHAAGRSLLGRVYMALGQNGRAVDYLLAAVQTCNDATMWFDLAVALYRNNQRQQSVQALETTLRLDAKRTDAWAMLVELAREIGADDFANDALTAFAEIAPSDPRVRLLRSQAGIV
jgi:protein O-GlcNAc transferase